jgi:hypothetical protein
MFDTLQFVVVKRHHLAAMFIESFAHNDKLKCVGHLLELPIDDECWCITTTS